MLVCPLQSDAGASWNLGGWNRLKYVSRDHELYFGGLRTWLQIGINQVHVFFLSNNF